MTDLQRQNPVWRDSERSLRSRDRGEVAVISPPGIAASCSRSLPFDGFGDEAADQEAPDHQREYQDRQHHHRAASDAETLSLSCIFGRLTSLKHRA